MYICIYVYVYIYIKLPRIIGILSYILTLDVPNCVAGGEIHATCLASNLPENS